jgi:nitroreductase
MLKILRKTKYPILDVFLARRSSRALSDESISEQELMTLFDAARWAQSSYNNQPWRFIYARKNTAQWQTFFNFLVSANQVWAKDAQVLVVVLSKTTFDYNEKPSRTHSFDTGAACQNMALQGAFLDIVVHGMEGFDYLKARKELQIPDVYEIQAMFAIGKIGQISGLPENLQAKEAPSQRKPLDEIVFQDRFTPKKDHEA